MKIGLVDEGAPLASADEVDVVLGCAERSLAATSAKVEWRQEWRIQQSPAVRWRRRRGGLLAPVGRIAWRIAKAAWKRATRDPQFGHMLAKGVIEPSTGRYMLDFGSFAQIHDGEQTFGGRSGRSLATLDPFPTSGRSAEMMWLLQLLRGTTSAVREDQDVLHGTPCVRLAILIDLERASAATDGGLTVPPVDRFEQLRSLPAMVWIDGEHIRRVHLGDVGSRELTLELWDYDRSTDEFNWTRLPTFRSPAEAAMYAGERQPRIRALRRKLHLG